MEIDEMPVQPVTPQPQITLSEQALYFLHKAGQWANFIGIIGFVMTGLIVILALFIGTLFTTLAAFNPMMAGAAAAGPLLTVVYLLFAAFNFFFSYYLYQFGARIKKAILFNNTEDATQAFGKLKSFFKLWGITLIVILSLYALIFIFAIIGGAAGMMSR
ncbi:glucan phosphoethanolaminetransferase (alkaline phosphatase superfamily) [Mucilaginibacter sp. UYNi724]